MIKKLFKRKIQAKTHFKTLINSYICLFGGFCFLLNIPRVVGDDYIWTGAAGTTWNNSASWNPATDFPQFFSDTAIFNQATANYPTTLGQSISVGSVSWQVSSAISSFSPIIGTAGETISIGEIVANVNSGTSSVLSVNSDFNLSTITMTIDFGSGANKTDVPTEIVFGSTFSLSGDLSITGGDLTTVNERIVEFSGSNTFDSPITVSDNNVLVLSNVDAISGATQLNLTSSTIRANIAGISETIPIVLSSSGTIDTQSFDVTWGGAISGVGGVLNKASSTGTTSSKLILTGSNSYGSTVVLAGILQGDTSSISGNIAVSTGANVTFAQTGNGTESNTISGAGSVTVANVGAGTNLTLGGTNSYAGGTTIESGILSATSNANLGGSSATTLSIGSATFQTLASNTFTFPVSLTGAAIIDTLTNNPTIAGTITGAGSLEKISAGTLVLAPNPTTAVANSYSGGTTVTAGILQGTTVTLQGAISVANNANVTFSQSVAGTYAGILSDDPGNPIRSVTIDAGSSIITFTGANTYAGGTALDTGSLKGSATAPTAIQGDILAASGTTVIFDQSGTGTYPTGNPGSIHGAGGLTMAGPGTLVLSGANAYSGTTTITGGILSIGASANIGSGSLTMGTGTLLLTAAFTITKDVSLTGAGTIDTGANDDTITGFISGVGSLVKTGAGTLTLAEGSSPNNYTGGSVVTQGVLLGTTNTIQGGIQVANSGNVTFSQLTTGTYSGAITNVSGSTTGSVTIEGGTLIFSGANTYSGGTLVSTGTLQGTTTSLQGPITITSGADLIFKQTVSGTFAGSISDSGNSTTSVIIDSTGATVTFSQANSYSGGTEVQNGNLQGSATSPTAIQGNIQTSSGTTVIFQQSGTGTYPTGNPGSIQGAGGVKMVGPGTLVLSGTNNYSGTTTITGGVLSINASANIGSGSLTMGTGTLLLTAGFTITKDVSLTGVATINTGANNDTITGFISGVGSLIKTGTGTLTLAEGSSPNNYSGGSVVTQGILLGTTNTLQGGIQVANSGNVTFTQGSTGSYNGAITNASGSTTGSVTINGGVITFGGANTYSGGTLVNTGTLQGTTTSVQGAITLAGTSILIFNQSLSGTYSGILTSASSSSELQIIGGGSVLMTQNSSGFLGDTTVNGATLIMDGNLSNSAVTVQASSVLKGTGTVGAITNSGTISPGLNGDGVLTANGAVTFQAGSIFDVIVSPTTNNQLSVLGAATLTGELDVTIVPGFHGINKTYVILEGSSVTGTFSSISTSDFGFVPSVVYTATEVILGIRSLRPFVGFPYANANERSVGNNLDALSVAGELSLDFAEIIDSLQGQSIATINDALDQMHPAALSALAQTQVELGGELLSVLHHKRNLGCGCRKKNQVWVEPFGNWLHVKQRGMEIGFHATTRGVVMGYEHELFNCWTLGIGGAYSATDLKWSLDRGYSYVKGAWGSLYSDLILDRFYLGFSAYGGRDWYHTQRHLQFTTVDRQACSRSHGLDMGAQMSTAYYLGVNSFVIYPYALIDYLYLNNNGFKESGALSLDLDVNPYISSTLRVETGGAFRFVDRNREGTICIAPFLGMGYVWERPLIRTPYHAKFSGETISFTTWGWDKVWQMISFKMGLGIVYRCFTLDSEFIADISSKGGTPLVNQRANFRMSYGF